MSRVDLKVPKEENKVTLWIHPEGRVLGTMFLSYRSTSMEAIEPIDALNEPGRFLVLRRKDGEIRFYNKASIIRVEYEGREHQIPDDVLSCALDLMDGSRVEGTISHFLPPERSRLYDFLNLEGERFIKIYENSHDACLINKAYIVQAVPL